MEIPLLAEPAFFREPHDPREFFNFHVPDSNLHSVVRVGDVVVAKKTDRVFDESCYVVRMGANKPCVRRIQILPKGRVMVMDDVTPLHCNDREFSLADREDFEVLGRVAYTIRKWI